MPGSPAARVGPSALLIHGFFSSFFFLKKSGFEVFFVVFSGFHMFLVMLSGCQMF